MKTIIISVAAILMFSFQAMSQKATGSPVNGEAKVATVKAEKSTVKLQQQNTYAKIWKDPISRNNKNGFGPSEKPPRPASTIKL